MIPGALYYSRLSFNRDRIIRDDPKKGSADCGRLNVREDRILLNPSYCIGPVQPDSSYTVLKMWTKKQWNNGLTKIRRWNVAKC
ncbi:hypothetical protein AVEN_75300-1 [Araneus ventricosus]|uniref:Uncharacterized protein n=1 Tax=Araneus ventricosus TaxID=182803 RepID=A0A4Y2G2P1_ARAVE|nr:hypothetical protein AVEN_75300-1 [Araneus ventricosus]